jgi:hypothetical protein
VPDPRFCDSSGFAGEDKLDNSLQLEEHKTSTEWMTAFALACPQIRHTGETLTSTNIVLTITLFARSFWHKACHLSSRAVTRRQSERRRCLCVAKD